jgi:hypothetical protein
MIEMKRQTALAREDHNSRQRENGMMKELYEKMIMEIDSKNKQIQGKMEDQDRRGRELENVVYKVQKLEQEEMNRLKRILHDKILSDKEKTERDEEKARVLFQELARLGEEMRRGGKEEMEHQNEVMRRLVGLEGKVEEDAKR